MLTQQKQKEPPANQQLPPRQLQSQKTYIITTKGKWTKKAKYQSEMQLNHKPITKDGENESFHLIVP